MGKLIKTSFIQDNKININANFNDNGEINFMRKSLKVISIAIATSLLISGQSIAAIQTVTDGEETLLTSVHYDAKAEIRIMFQRFNYFDRLDETVEERVAEVIEARKSLKGVEGVDYQLYPIEYVKEDELWQVEKQKSSLADATPSGYEWHFVYINQSGDGWWDYDIKATTGSNYTDSKEAELGFLGTLSKRKTFDVTYNGVCYSECLVGQGNIKENNFFAVRLPQGYPENVILTIYANKWVDDGSDIWIRGDGIAYLNTQAMADKVKNSTKIDYDNGVMYYIVGSPNIAVPAQRFTWISDAVGWRVQNTDGTYLMNQRYQSNNLWYYMGADGYMLTNTTTPDGYQVNADGVRVQ